MTSRIQKIVLVFLSSMFFNALTSRGDDIAYSSGMLVAEITVSSWILVIKNEKEAAFALAEKLAYVAGDYSSMYNRFFVQGVLDCLYKKNIKEEARLAEMDEYQTALLLTCHYCWVSRVTQMFESASYESNEDYFDSAVKKAVIEIYGSQREDIIADIDVDFLKSHLNA